MRFSEGKKAYFGPPRHRRDAGAAHLDQVERRHHRNEGLDLVGLAGDLEDEMLGHGVDHRRLEGVRQPQRLAPLVAGPDWKVACSLDRRARSMITERALRFASRFCPIPTP